LTDLTECCFWNRTMWFWKDFMLFTPPHVSNPNDFLLCSLW